jgi:branched-chain amino acid transport system substrate-binding protein
MMKRLFKLIALAIGLCLIVVAVLLAGCAPKAETEKETGPIKIGFMGNLSAPSSLSAKAAAQLAVEEINSAGGILGRPVQLIIEDTKGEIPKCVEIYKKLVMVDKVHLVIIAEKVEMGVAGMETGAELYPEYPHIFINTIGSGDVIWHHVRDNYDKYRFGFQTYYFTSTGYLTILGAKILPEFYKDSGIKRIALVYEDMAWTEPLRKGLPGVAPRLAEVYKDKGLDVVYETTVSLDQKVFTSIFEQVAAKGAEMIDCTVGYIDEVAFVKQWAESAARDVGVYMWGGLVGMPAAWGATEGKVLGVSVGSSQVKVAITDKTIPFMENLQAKYNVGPIFGSHTTYDSIYGFKKAVEKAGTTKADSVIKELERVREVAVLGTIGWDARYHYNLPYPEYITPTVQWQKGGQMVVVWPKDIAVGKWARPAELRK